MSQDPRPRDESVARVEAALTEFLRGRRERTAEIDPRVSGLVAELEAFVLGGGKRIRPRFALAGRSATPGVPAGPAPDEVVRACAALELIQACALVHDDIIDASLTRRGNPTVHRAVAAAHARSGWSGDAGRYGESQAILLGDLALSWADELFLGSGMEAGALLRALHPWTEMKTEVLSGQMLDVLAEASGADDGDTPRRVNRFKTAAYTVERPLHIGAALAGAGEQTVAALREFGVAIGAAFQLRDDLLGVFGDPEVTGKPSGDDLREGKRTVLVATGIALAGPDDAAAIRTALGVDLGPDALEHVRGVLRDCGAEAAVEDEITRLSEHALAAIAGPEITEDGRATLVRLATAATARRA